MNRIVEASPPRLRSLRPDVPDEVETIVMKCLSKDRSYRYETAGGLSKEIRRFLGGEAIEAKRGAPLYILRKLAQQHWVGVAIGAMCLIALLGAFVSTLVAWKQAERQAQESYAGLDLLAEIGSLQKELGQSEEWEDVHRRSLLLAERVSGLRFQDASIDYRVHVSLAQLLNSLRDWTAAADESERALMAAHRLPEIAPERLGALGAVSWAYGQLAWPEKQRAAAAEMVRLSTRIFGEASCAAIDSRLTLADIDRVTGDWAQYEDETRTILAAARQCCPRAVRQGAKVLAEFLCDEELRYDDALALQEEALAAARATDCSADIADCLHSLGHLLLKRGDSERAAAVLAECVVRRDRLYGPSDRDVFFRYASQSQFGQALLECGNFARAEQVLKSAWAGFQGTFTPRWEDDLPEFRRQTASRLVDLYQRRLQVNDTPELANKLEYWREQLAGLTVNP